MQSKWEFYSDYDPTVIDRMIHQFRIPRPVARVLYNRGISEKDDVHRFVNPSVDHLHDPFLMRDMEKAVERLMTALRERENILIYGDYDVDGITSVALLYLFLKDLGGEVSFYIPDRVLEGYGLSRGGVETANERDCGLIISVDCGITSVEEVLFAKSFGIDVIVSDHHEPAERLPDAVAVLDPKRSDCSYPFKELAGVGVAYKLAQGITQKLDLNTDYCENYLALVAMGTAADIVPLIDENRVLVKIGLEKLNDDGLEGVTALIEAAGLQVGEIDVGRIIFTLAPRINAVGRLGRADPAVELLVTRDHRRARKIAAILEEKNGCRKEIDGHTLNQALARIADEYDSEEDLVIVVAEEGWHPGVIGIVASRIIERYYRPTVMIGIEDGIGKGSARSIPNFDLYSALKSCEDLLLQFGGHKYAAGLTIDADKIPEFKRRFNEVTHSMMMPEDLIPKIKIDDELKLEEATHKLFQLLNRLAPFGPRNSRPLFMSQGLDVIGEPRIVGRDHLKFRVGQDGIVLDAIAFGRGADLPLLKKNRIVDLVYYLDEDRWRNRNSIQLKVKDLH